MLFDNLLEAHNVCISKGTLASSLNPDQENMSFPFKALSHSCQASSRGDMHLDVSSDTFEVSKLEPLKVFPLVVGMRF